MSYQPAPASGPVGQPPPSNLVWAILVTIFCCLPGGIVSIVFAAQVDSKWSAGDAAGARQYSDRARQWAIWSAVIGVIVTGLLVAVQVLAIGTL